MLQNNKNYILRMKNWKSKLPDSSNDILCWLYRERYEVY